jgi:hypothetical protein
VRGFIAGLTVVAIACAPTLTSTDSLVTAPRVLAVRAEPAEAKPGATVTFDALIAAPRGAVAGTPAWSFCVAPKPLTDDNTVSNVCVGPSALRRVGNGVTVTASTPSNGCSLFGPDIPPGGLRPRDPDDTGGFYQPLRVDLGASAPAFALMRISCDLPNASARVAAAFAQAYAPNRNPQLLPLTASIAGSAVALDAIPIGSRVDLRAGWSASSAETYAYYDASSDAVGTKRESLTLAWYSTAGSLDKEATGRAEDDLATSSDNTWTAPSSAGVSQLWVVLRDSRGGVDFASYQLSAVRRP